MARVQTLFIRKIVVKIETKAPMAHVRELLIQVQKEMVMEDRFKSLIVYYDVDLMEGVMIDICNMLQTKGKTKILFVCLGNICRSSSAEGVMKQLIEQAGREDEFIIDSAGFFFYYQGELARHWGGSLSCRRGV